MEVMVGVVVFCWFFLSLLLLLLQQEGLGGGIAVVIVGMAEDFSSGSEGVVMSFTVLMSSLGGRELRTQQHGPRDLSHWHPVCFAVSDDSVKVSSQVTKILTATSMPDARSRAKAPDSSSEIHEVQELFLTTQTNSRRRTGSRCDEAR